MPVTSEQEAALDGVSGAEVELTFTPDDDTLEVTGVSVPSIFGPEVDEWHPGKVNKTFGETTDLRYDAYRSGEMTVIRQTQRSYADRFRDSYIDVSNFDTLPGEFRVVALDCIDGLLIVVVRVDGELRVASTRAGIILPLNLSPDDFKPVPITRDQTFVALNSGSGGDSTMQIYVSAERTGSSFPPADNAFTRKESVEDTLNRLELLVADISARLDEAGLLRTESAWLDSATKLSASDPMTQDVSGGVSFGEPRFLGSGDMFRMDFADDGSFVVAGTTQSAQLLDDLPAPLTLFPGEGPFDMFAVGFAGEPEIPSMAVASACGVGAISEAVAGQIGTVFHPEIQQPLGGPTDELTSVSPEGYGFTLEPIDASAGAQQSAPIPLLFFFWSPFQSNVYIPEDVPAGRYRMVLRRLSEASALNNERAQSLPPPVAQTGIEITADATTPCIFTANGRGNGTVAGIGLHDTPSGREQFFLAQRALPEGAFGLIFGTGVAPITAVQAGAHPVALVNESTGVRRDGEVVVNGPFLVPGFFGLWQWNVGPVVFPADLPAGDYDMEATLENTNTVTLPTTKAQ